MSEVIPWEEIAEPKVSPQAIGRTVFELLARPMEMTEPAARDGTWTMRPTQWVTGDPRRWVSDYDTEPDND